MKEKHLFLKTTIKFDGKLQQLFYYRHHLN